MSSVDRLLNFIGAAAAGLGMAGASEQLPLPWWVKLICAGIAYAAPASAQPVIRRNSLAAGKRDARGQIADREDPK
jgi:hypothetical protein